MPRIKSTSHKLLISFWDIGLDNLPEGTFVHRHVTPDDARRHIEQARRENRLLCLSNDDLLAPFRKHERKNHDALRAVLKKHFGIALSFKDFVSEAGGDGLYSINPLTCVQLQGRDQLLVITCAYVLGEKRKAAAFNFKVEPTTVKFHIIKPKEDSK